MMIPYLCPELPPKQQEALHYGVKVPLVYTAVALRNWTAFKKLGIRGVQTPGMYHSTLNLEQPTDIGDYRPAISPEQPILARMLRTPCKPGLSARDQQRAGHADLLSTPFSTFERNIRDQIRSRLGDGRVRSGARYRRHHGESLAAWLRVRIQFPVGSGMAEGRVAVRDRTTTLRAYFDREFGRGRGGLHRSGHRSGLPGCAGTTGCCLVSPDARHAW